MKHLLFMLILLVQWPRYSATIPVHRLVLYRATNAGQMSPYVGFWDLTTTAYADSAVTSGLTYCYELRAFTATDVGSPPTTRVCAAPLP